MAYLEDAESIDFRTVKSEQKAAESRDEERQLVDQDEVSKARIDVRPTGLGLTRGEPPKEALEGDYDEQKDSNAETP